MQRSPSSSALLRPRRALANAKRRKRSGALLGLKPPLCGTMGRIGGAVMCTWICRSVLEVPKVPLDGERCWPDPAAERCARHDSSQLENGASGGASARLRRRRQSRRVRVRIVWTASSKISSLETTRKRCFLATTCHRFLFSSAYLLSAAAAAPWLRRFVCSFSWSSSRASSSLVSLGCAWLTGVST
eukprot:scaffold260_cov274-Pinguiococcus_pyrenoidosus.AAC.33